MKIEFDTATATVQEASALVAMIGGLFGPESLATTFTDAADKFDNFTREARPRVGPVVTQGAPGPAIPEAATLDSAGTPWDERIHSSSKGTNKDGTWSRRRNTPDDLYNSVMAELKGAHAEAAGGHQEAVAETPAPPPPASASDAFAEPAAPPPPASTGPITFPQLMVKITKAQTAGTLTKADVDTHLGSLGFTGIAQLASADADTLAAMNALIDG